MIPLVNKVDKEQLGSLQLSNGYSFYTVPTK